MIKKIIYSIAFGLSFTTIVEAQLPEKDIDVLVNETMKTFEVPGIAVGIIKDGKTVLSKGYGLRSLTKTEKVDEHTLFGIASNSKGFTCIALGMLVDEGRMKWDDPVRKYIPEFQTANPYVTEHFSIKDLVTHRGGMGLGAGDLMFFPEGSDFTIDDVIYNMRFMDLKSDFRNSFNYNNNLFIIAGEVLRRISGMTWEDFIEKRILKPVGMTGSTASYTRAEDIKNKIDAHAPADGKVIQVPHDWSNLANPAGGIMSNIVDMNTWAQFLMKGGKTQVGVQIISQEQLNYIFQLHNPLEVKSPGFYNTHFNGYGLGYFISDVKGGFKQIAHTGGLLGTVTQFTVIPELNLGITVLTNQQQGAAFTVITNTIKDYYLGYENRKWLEIMSERNSKYIAGIDSGKRVIFDKLEKGLKCTPHPNSIIGTYKDKWFGAVVIEESQGKLNLRSVRNPMMKGVMQPYEYNTYVVKWDNRSFDADVFAIFNFNEKNEAISFSMKPISEITDFSFDFEHLFFSKVK